MSSRELAEASVEVDGHAVGRRAAAASAGLVRAREYAGEYAIVLVFIALFVVLTFASNVFLTRTNLLNVVDQSAPIGILACALTLVLIAGEFDLSAGAILVMCGIVAAKLQPSLGTAACLIVAILASTVLGLGNGVLVNFLRINSFVCTLATSLMIAGLGLVITGGFLVTVSASDFGNLGFNQFIGVKYSIWLFLAFALACGFLLSRTRYGRWLFAVGGNAEAARLSGINTRVVKTIAFAMSGLAAGVGGAILASRSGQGQAGDGIQMVLSAFAAVVVGGTSVAGGRGAIWRTVLGVLFLDMIGNGFNLIGVDPVYQQIVEGGIILAAVAADALGRRNAV